MSMTRAAADVARVLQRGRELPRAGEQAVAGLRAARDEDREPRERVRGVDFSGRRR